MARWSDLPTELKVSILGFVDANAPRPSTRFPSQLRRAELRRYASVSREWQLFFEQQLYSRLTLTQHCLTEFNKLVPRQRQLVRYIWLRIVFDDYTCSKCPGHTDQGLIFRNNKTFVDSIAVALRILHTWGTRTKNDLTLEISGYSPSDVKHVFKGDKFLNSDSIEMEDMVPEKESFESDPSHGLRQGRRTFGFEISDVNEAREYMGFYLLDAPLSYSIANVVTGLVFRRTTRRPVVVNIIVQLLQRLPNLRHFTYETWRLLKPNVELTFDGGYRNLILNCLPKTLKTLNWFEDFNEVVNRIFYDASFSYPISPIRKANSDTSSALAMKSLSLEHVTGCYSVDAVPFFGADRTYWTWQNLSTLSLTCSLFTNPDNYHEIVILLGRVGMALKRMPRLQALDIWYGMRHCACAFRHRVTDGRITISWRGTWELDLESEVTIRSRWGEVAKKRGIRNIYVSTYRPVKSKDVISHAAAIRLLEIGQNVLHPASLEEISREVEYYFPSQ